MSGCLVAAALFASAVARRLAGLTGDVYGAMNEIAEISFIALFAVLL
jgi:cobalamin synthase